MLVVSGVDVCNSESWLPPSSQGLHVKGCVCVVMSDIKVCTLNQSVCAQCVFSCLSPTGWVSVGGLGSLYVPSSARSGLSTPTGYVCAGVSVQWTCVL